MQNYHIKSHSYHNIKNMSVRRQKKAKVGQFTQLCFLGKIVLKEVPTVELNQSDFEHEITDYDKTIEWVIQAVESLNLCFGGGFEPDQNPQILYGGIDCVGQKISKQYRTRQNDSNQYSSVLINKLENLVKQNPIIDYIEGTISNAQLYDTQNFDRDDASLDYYEIKIQHDESMVLTPLISSKQNKFKNFVTEDCILS